MNKNTKKQPEREGEDDSMWYDLVYSEEKEKALDAAIAAKEKRLGRELTDSEAYEITLKFAK